MSGTMHPWSRLAESLSLVETWGKVTLGEDKDVQNKNCPTPCIFPARVAKIQVFELPTESLAVAHSPSTDNTPSRYVVGFDLGTTNSAVTYVDTTEEPWHVRVFAVPQLVAAGQVETRETLPSFHYQPGAGRTAASRAAFALDHGRSARWGTRYHGSGSR